MGSKAKGTLNDKTKQLHEGRNDMRKTKASMGPLAIGVSALILTIAVVGCSESLITQGYVTGRTDNKVFIDVGSANGIQAGDELQLYAVNEKRAVLAGKVKVEKVLGDNSSIAVVLNGNPVRGDKVEKWKSR